MAVQMQKKCRRPISYEKSWVFHIYSGWKKSTSCRLPTIYRCSTIYCSFYLGAVIMFQCLGSCLRVQQSSIGVSIVKSIDIFFPQRRKVIHTLHHITTGTFGVPCWTLWVIYIYIYIYMYIYIYTYYIDYITYIYIILLCIYIQIILHMYYYLYIYIYIIYIYMYPLLRHVIA